MSIIVGFLSRKPGIAEGVSIPGFLLDIVRGAREFKRNIDSIEHQRDAKARTSEGEGQ